MRTMIAVPCMDTVHTLFFSSMMNLHKPEGTEIAISCSSLVYTARNLLAKKAIDEGFDRVLWLDSDMVFHPTLLQKLSADLDEGRDFVTALCFGRKNPVGPTIYKETGYTQEDRVLTPFAKKYTEYPKNEIFEVEACGFACVLMRMDMLKAMAIYGVPFYPVGGMGEDLTFCWRARKLDMKFWCDSRLKIGHLMRISVDEQFRDTVMAGSANET